MQAPAEDNTVQSKAKRGSRDGESLDDITEMLDLAVSETTVDIPGTGLC